MGVANTIVKNTLVTIAANVIGRILSFFLIIAIARELGDVGAGVYFYAFAFVGVIGLFNDIGLTQLMIREMAKDKKKARHYFNNFLTMRILLTLATTIVALCASFFLAKSSEEMYAIWIIAGATFFLEMATSLTVVFISSEKMEYSSLSALIERIFSVGLGLAALYTNGTVIALMFAFLISYFITFVYSYLTVIYKFFSVGFGFDIELWKKLLKEAMPFWLTSVFTTIYFRIDTIMLKQYTGLAVVGWYSAAHALLDALYFIPASVIAAVFPAMSRSSTTDKSSLHEIYRRAFYYLFLLALPLGIGTTILADKIILFIYPGDKFLHSIVILKILIWAEVIIFVSYLNGYLLNSINKQKLFTIATAVGAVFNIGLNLLLIPKYSYIGTSIAIVASELLVFSMLFYYVNREGYRVNLLKVAFKPLIAGIGMGGALLYLRTIIPDTNLSLFILGAAGFATYLAIIFLIKGIGSEEIGIVRSFFKKN